MEQVKVSITGDSDSAEKSLHRTSSAMTGLGSSISPVTGILGIFSGVIAGIGFTEIAKGVVTVGMAFDRLEIQLKTVTGSAELGAKELAFLTRESNRLGLDLLTTSESFAKFSFATKGTSLEGEATRKIFSGLMEGISGMSLSTEQAGRIMLQFQQMMSKGKLSAEDLNVVAESMPAPLRAIADAMGKSTAEVSKMMEQGKLLAIDVLPLLAEHLHKTLGKAAVENANSAQGAFNRFGNEIKSVGHSISEFILPPLQKMADLATTASKGIRTAYSEGESDYERFTKIQKALYSPSLSKQGRDQAIFEAKEGVTSFEKEAAAQAAENESQSGWASGSEISRNTGRRQKELADIAKMNAKTGTKEKLYSSANPRALAVWTEIMGAGEAAWANILSQDFGGLPGGDEKNYSTINYDNPEGAWNSQGILSLSQQGMLDANIGDRQATNRNSAALAQEAEFLALRDDLRGNSSSMELLRINQEEQYWVDSWAMQTDSYDVYEARKGQIAQLYANQRVEVERAETQRKLQIAASGFSATASLADSFYKLSGQKNKTMFRAFQAMKSGETVISTASAAMNAFNDGAKTSYYLGVLYAASTVAAGAVQLANIWGASDSGSGSISGGSSSSPGGGYSSPIVTQPISTQSATPTMHIEIHGNVIGEDKWVEESLAPTIRSLAGRNVTFGFVKE